MGSFLRNSAIIFFIVKIFASVRAQENTSDVTPYYILEKPIFLNPRWVKMLGIENSLIFDQNLPKTSFQKPSASRHYGFLRRSTESRRARTPASINEDEKVVIIKPSLTTSLNRFSQLESSFQNYYSRIDTLDTVNGANGSIISKINFSTQFSWIQNWSYVFKSFLRIRLARETYATDSSRPETSFIERNKTLSGFSFGTRKQIGKFYHQEELGFSQQVYLKGLTDLSGVELVAAAIPNLNINAGYYLVNIWPYFIYSDVGVILTAPGVSPGFNTHWNYGGQIKIGILQQSKSQSGPKVEFYYSTQNLDSSLSKSQRKDLGITASYTMRFGSDR